MMFVAGTRSWKQKLEGKNRIVQRSKSQLAKTRECRNLQAGKVGIESEYNRSNIETGQGS